MKVGGYYIIKQPTFQGGDQLNNYFGEWRQDLQVMAVVAMQVEEETHQHGD